MQAEDLRIAVFAAPLSRSGPGLLLQDITAGEDPQIEAVVRLVAEAAPDILVLAEFDYDHGGAALTAFAGALAEAGHPMPHYFALRPNTGRATGTDLNGDGSMIGPEDAQGFGYFSGDGGLAILSTRPLDRGGARDLSDLLWRDLPGAVLPVTDNGGPFPTGVARDVQRLSTTGHWLVPVPMADGPPLTLMVYAATPPVFDGSEDRNGLRNADETRIWLHVLAGVFGPVPESFVIAGKANLDPVDGEGRHEAIAALLGHPGLIDPRPASEGGRAAADPGHRGDPALDTADWGGETGNLRVSYILPSSDWTVRRAGVLWPAPGEDAGLAEDVAAAGPHRLVWVDLTRD